MTDPVPDLASGHAPGEGAEGLAEPMRSRWSPTIFDPEHELGDADIVTLLQAARWSPSFGNSQPWSFVVAPRGSVAHRMVLPHLRRGNRTWVPRASLVLLGATQVAPDPDGSDVPDADYARYDLGQAAAHLTLQAHAIGLRCHQFAGYDRAGVAAALEVPDHVQLLAGIAVGRVGPDDVGSEGDRERQLRPRTRRPLAEMTHAERWGLPWEPAARAT